jgi:hypothetical protein
VGVVILTAVGTLGSVGLVQVIRFFFSDVDIFPQ